MGRCVPRGLRSWVWVPATVVGVLGGCRPAGGPQGSAARPARPDTVRRTTESRARPGSEAYRFRTPGYSEPLLTEAKVAASVPCGSAFHERTYGYEMPLVGDRP